MGRKARGSKIGYSLSFKAHNDITYIRGSEPKVKKKQAKINKEAQTSGSGLGAEGEKWERASAGVAGSPEQLVEKDSSASSSLGYQS